VRRAAHTQTLNFITDLITLLAMVALAGTGLLLRFVLPPGSRGGHGLQLWNLTRHDWGDVHFWLSIVLGTLVVVHVALHWTWVCSLVARRVRSDGRRGGQGAPKRRMLSGVAAVVAVTALLVVFVWVARFSITKSVSEPEHGGRGTRGGRRAASLVLPGIADSVQDRRPSSGNADQR
jgi:heme/copper-type cytochrome/quinol oxidase subunit 2